jgi:stage IV sporulation protein FB
MAFSALSGFDGVLKLLVFSVLHETGHLTALLLLSGTPKELTFSYYGFALKYEDTLTPIKESIVLLSGPAVNLMLFIILKDGINPVLMLLNLLPVYPLDGGRVIRLISLKLSKVLSAVFIVIISLIALYSLFSYNSYSLLLISVYLLIYQLSI